MKTILLNKLKRFLLESIDDEEDSIEVDDVVATITANLKMFKYITFSKITETEDYVIITVNANNPDRARKDLSSFKFAHATNFDIVPMRKTIQNGYQLEVFDSNGEPFDKDIYIRIRRGGEFNAGVRNEMDVFQIIQNSLDNGINSFFFHCGGAGVSVENVVSVRQCGSDPGSRMGNRADIELKTKDGTLHKFSLKKDSAYKVAGLVRKFAKEKFKIGKIVRNWFRENDLPFKDCYITVKITNEELYKWCWFGNDINENGAVLVGDIDASKVQTEEGITSINFSYVLEPSEFSLQMMDDHPAYFMVGINKHGAVEVRAAVMGKFGRRYLVDDLYIPGVNDERIPNSLIESNKPNYKYSIYCGYNLFTDCDENREVFTKRIQISNMGNRGKIPVAIVSESDTEVKFRFWKYNESQHCYGPEMYDGESTGKIANIEYGKWVSNGGCGMKELE